MKDRKLEMSNMSLGMRRDGSIHTEGERSKYGSPLILQSLKTIENYDIVYTDGMLRTRDGYTRWTDVALPGTPKQLYYHSKMDRLEDMIFVICHDPVADIDRWYRVMQTGQHEKILDPDDPNDPDCPSPTATSPDTGGYRKPIISWGDRVIFSTDTGTYWTDRDRLYDGVKYYDLGIAKPTSTMHINTTTALGNNDSDDAHEPLITGSSTPIMVLSDTATKIADRYTPTSDIVTTTIKIKCNFWQDVSKSGSIKVRIETDLNNRPSGTLVDEYATTEWMDVKSIYETTSPADKSGDYVWAMFNFKGAFTLKKNVIVWIIVECDASYALNFEDGLDIFAPFFIAFAYYPDSETTTYSLYYTHAGWVVDDKSFAFFFSGFESGHIYEYLYTYYNSIYGIESRPAEGQRLQTLAGKGVSIDIEIPSDEQVDSARIYRREFEGSQGMDALEEEIVDTYKLVGEVSFTDYSPVFDSANTMLLGAELQTFDHYCLRDSDDTNSALRSAIVPIGMVIWKGRIFAWLKDSNRLYFSKRLSENGASGLGGDMIPDFFPLENELEIECPSAILQAKPLSGDQLAIYFRNGSIWLLWGMDAPENPPDQYALREQITTIGLTASGGLTEFRGSHVYLSRQGLYQFTGNQIPQYMSEFIQSILDGVSDSYIDDTRIITYGEEIWILLDEDNDGYKEVVYIFNLQKSVPSWRRYNYNIKIADVIIKSLGEQQRTIYAADATNNHIIQLETGHTDNGMPIESYFETHRTRVSNARFGIFELSADYTTHVAGHYDITLTDHVGREFKIGLSPSSSDDERGHRSGVRGTAKTAFMLKVAQASVEQTDILGFKLSYNED